LLLIDAVYINNGGGKILLEYLIEQLDSQYINYTLLIDHRLSINNKNLVLIKNSEIDRKNYYKKNVTKFTKIFCFANVPPPIVIRNIKVYIYFHNVLLFKTKGINFPLKQFYLLKLKSYYIKFLNKYFYNWVVQTSIVEELLRSIPSFKKNIIHVLPFYKVPVSYLYDKQYKSLDFIYIANGSKHKNHFVLLDAWREVNKKYNYKLILTISEKYVHLINRINQLKNEGCLIENLGEINHNDALNLMLNSDYMIYPSLYESYGMPLIEGAIYKCKIIASDLPYVFQVITPSNTFDPFSYTSIATSLNNINNLEPAMLNSKNQIHNLINLLK
jgi:hypothetical protein